MSEYGHFGRCWTEDTCMMDQDCEFFTLHEGLPDDGGDDAT